MKVKVKVNVNVKVYTIRTIEEGRTLAKELAQSCPNPEQAYIGLLELLINAVEHGNLEVGYETKTQLQSQQRWKAELQRRTKLPKYAAREVTLQTYQTEDHLCFLIQDQGQGFDWHPYLTISTDRTLHSHGRGIAMAREMSFDALEYQGRGNRVLAMIKIKNDNQ